MSASSFCNRRVDTLAIVEATIRGDGYRLLSCSQFELIQVG